MKHLYVVSAVMLCGLMGTGCVSISQVQTADTLGAGKFQFGFEPGVGGAAVLSQEDGASKFYYPHVDLSMRFGATDNVDLGVRFGSSLVELQSKFLVTSPQDPTMAVSLAPSLMWFFLDAGENETLASYANLALPVLVGLKTSGGSEFVLGPRLSLTRLSLGTNGDSGSLTVVSAGASAGYALRVSDGFRIMPEVAISYPFLGAVDTSTTDSQVLAGFKSGFVQLKLGFLFGGGRPVPRPAD